ncbi:TIM barrel protein [Cohnella sp. CBP 2801]|uniref:TIM barrel protein n=2 Tax=Cohnella zeiphila TaxID=2761120 RepID=A0A7X0SJN2_9BACL|nr:TIM barrel protein [Cohnella zeiphila]MBB6729915.1 TIM barrel protein [Cohnella zeiphila]
MSWWGMSGLGTEGEDSAEARFRRIAEAGFDGINGFVPAPEEAGRWRRLLDEYSLTFSVNAYPRTAADMAEFLRAAKEFGRVEYVNAQVMTPFVTGAAAERLLRDIAELSREAGIPVYVETHRGTITQDLLRTIDYAERIEELRLTIDYSHYVVAGELHTIGDEAEALLQRLLPRTSSIHARVSNGEQVQVNLSDDGEHPMLPHFKRWWRDGMRHWLGSARSGERFPFVCELGPPSYAITADEQGARTKELGDRWKQSLQLANIARGLWSEAAAAGRG